MSKGPLFFVTPRLTLINGNVIVLEFDVAVIPLLLARHVRDFQTLGVDWVLRVSSDTLRLLPQILKSQCLSMFTLQSHCIENFFTENESRLLQLPPCRRARGTRCCARWPL